MATDPNEIDAAFGRAAAEGGSTEEMLEKVYAELRTMAGGMMRGERAHHTLQPTALVHEALVRLNESPSDGLGDRLQFLAAASIAMRRVLVDHARTKSASKRGGGWNRVTLLGIQDDSAEDAEDFDLVDLDAALARMSELDPRQARIVEMRFFSGMTGQEIAEHLGISRNTVVRELTHARAWLQRELTR